MQLGLARPAARSRRGSTHSLFRHVWEVAKSLGPGQVGGNDSDYLESPLTQSLSKRYVYQGQGSGIPKKQNLGQQEVCTLREALEVQGEHGQKAPVKILADSGSLGQHLSKVLM